MSIQIQKLNIPAGFPAANAYRQTSDTKGNARCCRYHCGQCFPQCLSDVVQCHYHIFHFLDCYSFHSDWEGRVESFFFSPLRMSEVFLCRLPTASVVFVSGASQRLGSRISKFFSIKYYPWKGVEIFRQKICVPNPVFTFAPATKMTHWCCPEGGMETEAYM